MDLKTDIGRIFAHTQSHPQLVHNITNYVTVNDCANVLLAMGSSPIMADDPREVTEITKLCTALVINIGTLNAGTIDSMLKAGGAANEAGRPVVLDPVGAGASRLRTETAQKLVERVHFAAIRGNVSEIMTLAGQAAHTQGVDAADEDKINTANLTAVSAVARRLALELDTVVVISGAIDIITDGETTITVENGHPDMSRISGTGCMLSAMTAAYLAANPLEPVLACTATAVAMGLAGERAVRRVRENALGTGSLRTYIIDEISLLDECKISSLAKVQAVE